MKKNLNFQYLLIFLFTATSLAGCDCKQYLENEKNIPINGVVVKKFYDDAHHGVATLVLQEKGKRVNYGTVCFQQLFNVTQVGDSISKPRGTLEHKIFRKDSVIILYPIINGDTLR